jgi:hypothetical protein
MRRRFAPAPFGRRAGFTAWRAAIARGAFALLLLAPPMAHPQSLPQLLRLPLERLLQLEISAPAAPADGASTSATPLGRPHAA